jgi:hypothetical protein
VVVGEEGCSEDITGTGGIDLLGRIGGETAGVAVLEKGGSLTAIGGDEQRD